MNEIEDINDNRLLYEDTEIKCRIHTKFVYTRSVNFETIDIQKIDIVTKKNRVTHFSELLNFSAGMIMFVTIFGGLYDSFLRNVGISFAIAIIAIFFKSNPLYDVRVFVSKTSFPETKDFVTIRCYSKFHAEKIRDELMNARDFSLNNQRQITYEKIRSDKNNIR